MANGIVFHGGIPYALDIKKLTEAFPVEHLAEGTLISHERLESVLGIKRQMGRYYGVLNSWIGRLKAEQALILAWEKQSGLRVLDPASVLSYAETRTQHKARQLSRAVKLFGWVQRDRLDEVGQKRLDHQLRVVAAVAEATTKARKELAVELAPVKSLPKRLPQNGV